MVAKAAVTTPAPPGHASGVAVQVGSLLDVSKTEATADSGAPSAQASVVRVGGQPLLDLGGTQKGDGETAGSLVDTGASVPARVEVAPWKAAAHGSGGATRHAKSSAALARAELPEVAKAGVLTSDSEASWTDQKSTGMAVTDAVNVSLLDTLNIVLLHSEVTSEGRGHSYLVGLNGTEIGTDDQLGNSPLCALNVPSLLSLSCLTASGGDAAGAGGLTSGTAEIARVDPVIGAVAMADPVAAFTAASSSGTGAAPIATPAPVPAPLVSAGEAARTTDLAPAAEMTGQATGRLPRTGTNPASLLATGLVALTGGMALRRFRRRSAGR
ncbi:MAG TPA: LPXTG cell wall anchor domain-containing protein [Acidimicrobiia bacterium]|nr:LPXTG cell wall anchor domain-containing protein [Acidimicrobiia bacterium]